ncbi:PHB depolymerase family esterase [Corynebacterium sp.]|uniref:alpha/beta hydrolase family esterase n=1 Tax=Corynebacterium sp. TaxID=1720 RepID=UPI0026DB03B9|nr:hypothetical protein [Corynebacterium sp.]MDO5032404.1 hypothetical protein [Corynebacterium sp.]
MKETLEIDGLTRTFTVVEPEKPRDLLLFFHGSLQSGSVMRRFTDGTFDELARRTGCVLIYPDGVDRHFNDYRRQLPVKARELGVDDIAFTRALVSLAQRRYGTQRTFACGYSNGGQMVLRLLFDAPGLLHAACVFASTLGEGDNHAPSNPDSAYRPTPLMFMHGTADPYAPYEGGVAGLDPQRTRGRVTSALWTAKHMAQLNGAAAEPVLARPYPDVEVRTWEGENPVEFWTMLGAGHVIPSGKELDPRIGPNTDSFLAADVVGRFFGLR